jgi:hypothetical protein
MAPHQIIAPSNRRCTPSLTKRSMNKYSSSIHEGRLFVCFVLFCFSCTYEVHLNPDALDRVFGLFGNLWRSRRRGASAWFHDVLTCSVKSS